MARKFNWEDVDVAATEMAGNFQKFENFCYFGGHDETWCVVYTSNCTSGLLDESNEAIMRKALAEFPDDAELAYAGGAAGRIDGFELRVYDETGAVTKAFEVYCELQAQLAQYPVLDEEDWSNREYEATLKSIAYEVGRLELNDKAPEDADDVADAVYSWLSNNDQCAIESHDDQGGYPDDDELEAALIALGWLDAEDEE